MITKEKMYFLQEKLFVRKVYVRCKAIEMSVVHVKQGSINRYNNRNLLNNGFSFVHFYRLYNINLRVLLFSQAFPLAKTILEIS